jgi:hypothetical protein
VQPFVIIAEQEKKKIEYAAKSTRLKVGAREPKCVDSGAGAEELKYQRIRTMN